MDKAKKPQFKKIRELLKERSSRDRQGLFVAEGGKIVLDAIKRHRGVVSVFISAKVVGAPVAREITALCESNKLEVWRVPAAEFEQLSSLNNSQGILAILRKPEWKDTFQGKFHVLCDGVQDPGNLGAIIRTSVAFGASSVFLLGATADVFNPKVVRSSSGTVMDIPVRIIRAEYLDEMKSRGIRLYAATSDSSNALDIGSLDVSGKSFILTFGNEGKGLSKEVLNRVDSLFYISISPAAESLNVTAAAAIAIYCLSEKIGE